MARTKYSPDELKVAVINSSPHNLFEMLLLGNAAVSTSMKSKSTRCAYCLREAPVTALAVNEVFI